MRLFVSRILASLMLLGCTVPARADWTQSNTGLSNMNVYAIAVSGTSMFAATNGGGVYRSLNDGATWTTVNSGLTNLNVTAIAVSGTYLYAGTNGGGVYLSTNNGGAWFQVIGGLGNLQILSLVVDGGNIFAGTNGGGVYLTTNNGSTWNSVGLVGKVINSLIVSGTSLFAGTTQGGVYLSTNSGTIWTAMNSGLTGLALNVFAIAASGTYLFAGTADGVYRSANNGNSWTSVNTGLPRQSVFSFGINTGIALYAGTINGVYYSLNNGDSWAALGLRSATSSVRTFAVSNIYIFTGTLGTGVWKRLLSDYTTDVQATPSGIPSRFALEQNYPNPFNPSTSIVYETMAQGRVSLAVYDVLGRRVALLVDDVQEKGRHRVMFEAEGLASGMYLCRLTQNAMTATVMMIIQK